MSSIHDQNEETAEDRRGKRLVALGFLVVVIIIGAVFAAAEDPANCTVRTAYKRSLFAITNVPDSITGQFYFLGSGTIQGSPKYILKEVLNDGSHYVRSILQGQAITREDVTDGMPWVVYKEARLTFMNSGCDARERPESMEKGTHAWYEIHIPPGSEMQIVDVNPK